MYACSLDMTSLTWAQEIHGAIKKATSIVERLKEENTPEAEEQRRRFETIVQSLRLILQNLWLEDYLMFDTA